MLDRFVATKYIDRPANILPIFKVVNLSETNSNESGPAKTISAASDEAQPPATDQQSRMQLQIDDAQVSVVYSTTARVWGSAEEINLDFAGPIRPASQPNMARLRIDQRIVLNPWAAKRLAIALSQAVTRYEQTYGTLEIDERKRRVNGDNVSVAAT